MEKQLKQIGKNLKAARKQVRLRQVDIAEQSGVAYRHYQDIEAGKVNVSVDTLFRLTKVLKIHPAVLFSFTDCVEE